MEIRLRRGSPAWIPPSTVTFTEDVGTGPTAVLHAYGSIWVANHLDGTVTRLEPSTGKELATVHVGDDPSALGAAAGSLWVANGSTTRSARSTRDGPGCSDPSRRWDRLVPDGRGRRPVAGRRRILVPNMVAGP